MTKNYSRLYQWTGGKWLIHGSNPRNYNQSQSLKIPCRISQLEMKTWYTALIARLMGPTWGPSWADTTQVGPMNFAIWGKFDDSKFNPVFLRRCYDKNIPGRYVIAVTPVNNSFDAKIVCVMWPINNRTDTPKPASQTVMGYVQQVLF